MTQDRLERLEALGFKWSNSKLNGVAATTGSSCDTLVGKKDLKDTDPTEEAAM
jgi:hypothetical protein